MSYRRVRVLVLTVAGLVPAVATAAIAAPVATTPPTITGKPVVLGRIGCDPGVWTGATSVTTEWRYGRNRTSTARTLRILPTETGLIVCRVTATDASGATSVAAASVVPTPARTNLRCRLTSRGRRHVRLVGTAGPRSSLRVGGKRAKILLLPVSGGAVSRAQTLIRRSVPANGRFDITTTDLPGRHVYAVVLQTPDAAAFDGVSRRVRLTVKR